MWHGPDSGYFCFFIGAALTDILGRTFNSTAIANKMRSLLHPAIVTAILLIWH
jgi:hypothetical protein